MPKPGKGTLAKMKVMTDSGYSPNHIGKAIGHDPKSIRTWLKVTDFNDPELKELIERLKADEINELRLIGGKARLVIDNYLDSVLAGKKEPNPVAIVAIQDRSFSQRRLLEGLSTENIGVKSLVEMISKDREDLRKRKEALLRELEEAGE